MMCCFCSLVEWPAALFRTLRVKASRTTLSVSVMLSFRRASMGAIAFDTGFSRTKSKSANTAEKMGAETSCCASISMASASVIVSLRLARIASRNFWNSFSYGLPGFSSSARMREICACTTFATSSAQVDQ